jgi:eukaryotic-like serine/threonine-protein kinase
MTLPDKDQVRRHAFFALKIGLLALVLAGIAAFSAYYTVRHSVSGRDVQVPELTAMTVPEASALLQKSGLALEEAAERNDDTVEEGRILAQDPPAGSVLKLDRKVKVVVSLGNRITLTPELRGTAARRAQITLQQQGTRLGKELYVFSKRDAESQVIAQDPLPGGPAAREGKISLLVSRGPRPRTFIMPELVGRPERSVLAFLAKAGLRSAPSRHDAARVEAPGTVIAQDPDAGFPVSAGDLVTLTVAGEGGAGG